MTFANRALALLAQASEGGTVSRSEAEALARDWLEAVGANIALQVLTGGVFEARGIVELCNRIVWMLGCPDRNATNTRADHETST